MTAQLIDSVRALQYITVLAHRDPDKQAPNPPDPFPLPDYRKQREALNGKKVHEPGSFGFIATKHIAQIRKQRSAQCQEVQAGEK